jgi:hypothetical protein
MNKQPELLPCPFCGGELEVTKHFKQDLWGGVHRCPAIGVIIFDFTSRESIIKRWNKRVGAGPGEGGMSAGDIALVAPIDPAEIDKKIRAHMNDIVRRIIAQSAYEGRGSDIMMRIYLAGLYHGATLHKATGDTP